MLRNEPLPLDMPLAAKDAISSTVGMDQTQFNTSRLHQAAVIRCQSVIGEAANTVSPDFRATHLEIEWREIIGMRHRLIHNHGAVRLDVVWNTLGGKLPGLIAVLTPLVSPTEHTRP